MSAMKVGDRVEVVGKDVCGKVAYVGFTSFSPGKWIGLILDEPKGKNDGTVQGKQYFECQENYGMFVRQTQIKMLGSNENSPNKKPGSKGPSRENSGILTPRQKSDLSRSAKKEVTTPKRQKSDLMKSPESTTDAMETVKEESVVTVGSKLAQPRSRLPLPGSGRQPSFTNITRKTVDSTPKPEKQPFQRERSFVETNFVQTPRSNNVTQILPDKPIGTPGNKSSSNSSATASPSLSTVLLSEKMEEKVQNMQMQQEINNYKDEIKDLGEKLETLKVKRAQDKEKMKEFEKIVLQNEQLVEFKGRIMESQSALQKELQKAKHDAREAVEAKDRHAEEMADLSETVEMATLDKEMAEEKAETLQLELDAYKERVEELTLDLDIIKAEIADGGAGEVVKGQLNESATAGVTQFELKALQAQNEKLRDTLVSMRDLSAHEKHEITKLAKDLEEKVAELAARTKDNERLARQVTEMEQTISDLQEQVDAALGAEEMVESLTTKCLDLEDRVALLVEEKLDLEALHDINEEMQENAREIELELREEIDMAQAKVRELTRDKEAAMEVVFDHETTIAKFRSFVSQVQDQNRALKEALEKETSKPVLGAMGVSHEMLDFKKMFAETKAHAKAIDVELRRLEIQEAGTHVRYLMAYMGDSFLARGGDYEAIQVLLLVPRLVCKSDILFGQIKEQFGGVPDLVDRNSVLKGHNVDRFVFGSRLIHLLLCLNKTLHQFNHALSTCSVDTLLRVGTLYPEMSVHEKGLDFYIELLHKGQLDENVHVTNLEKTVSYFDTIYPMNLAESKTNCDVFLADHVKMGLAAVDNLRTEIKRCRVLMDPKSEGTQVGILMKTLENQLKDLELQVKNIKRRLPQDGSQGPITFPESVGVTVAQCSTNLYLVVKVFDAFGKNLMSLAASDPDAAGVPGPKIHDALQAAVDAKTDFGDQGIEFTTKSVAMALTKLSVIATAIQNGEYDFDGTRNEKIPPPILVRAEDVKAEIKDATGLKYKLEAKDQDIKDLKKLLKTKQEELSEMQVRKDLLEKKLADTNRDGDLMIDKLQRKLDDANNLLKRKEKEFEETMDHLQVDIDTLETERGELKDKMKQMSKKALIQGLSKSQGLGDGSGGGPHSLGPSVPSPVRDSPLLVQQVADMRNAVNSLQCGKARMQGQEMRDRLAKLKPIKLPKKLLGGEVKEKSDKGKDSRTDLGDLMRRCNAARSDLFSLLCSQEVVNVTRTPAGVSNSNIKAIKQREMREKALRAEISMLTVETAKLLAGKLDTANGQLHPIASFGNFASGAASKAVNEKDYSLMGRIRLDGDSSSEVPSIQESVPLLLDLHQLKQIHTKLVV